MSRESAVTPSQLEAEGWTRQFTTDAQRADEYVELYESMGEEVRVEPMSPELVDEQACATCLLAVCDQYVVIYTRPIASNR